MRDGLTRVDIPVEMVVSIPPIIQREVENDSPACGWVSYHLKGGGARPPHPPNGGGLCSYKKTHPCGWEKHLALGIPSIEGRSIAIHFLYYTPLRVVCQAATTPKTLLYVFGSIAFARACKLAHWLSEYCISEPAIPSNRTQSAFSYC